MSEIILTFGASLSLCIQFLLFLSSKRFWTTQLSFAENREMIRHQMAGIAQTSDGWNQFLGHRGGFGNATFRPNKRRMKQDVCKNATLIEIKKSNKSMTSVIFSYSCKDSTKCQQSPKHSNANKCLHPRVAMTNWLCCLFASFQFSSHFASLSTMSPIIRL